MKQIEITTNLALFVLVVLLLTIFVFKPSIYKNMIHTFLGRLAMLFILILITSHNIILGLMWCILIIYFYENYGHFEGLENMESSVMSSTSAPDTISVKDILALNIPVINTDTDMPATDASMLATDASMLSTDTSMLATDTSMLATDTNMLSTDMSPMLTTGMNPMLNIDIASASMSPNPKPDTSGVSSTPEIISGALIQQIKPEPNKVLEQALNQAMDQATKLEKERQVQKGNNSKSLPISQTSSTNVLPSDSTTTTSPSTMQGFANMFGSGYTRI